MGHVYKKVYLLQLYNWVFTMYKKNYITVYTESQ